METESRKRSSFDEACQDFVLENLNENVNASNSPGGSARKRSKPNVASSDHHRNLGSTGQIIAELKEIENSLFNAIPFSRNGDGKDDYTYLRVRPFLREIHGQLCSSDPSFELSVYFCTLLDRLPCFENPNFNMYKKNMALVITHKIRMLLPDTDQQDVCKNMLTRLSNYLE